MRLWKYLDLDMARYVQVERQLSSQFGERCTGPNNNNCKKCASGYFVLATYSDTSPVTYKWGKSWPSLAEVATVSTQSVWNTWYGSAKPVYDFTTKTCITDTATWPANTVKTTLDKITNINKSIVQSSTVDATTECHGSQHEGTKVPDWSPKIWEVCCWRSFFWLWWDWRRVRRGW